MNCKNCCVIACDGYGYDNEPERCEFYTRMSHGDRIRSYSDKELALQIVEWNNGDCPPIEFCPKNRNEKTHYVECTPWKCWLEYLQEVEDDNDND